ncbi:MAG TPA: four helix bundle protein [Bacteroidales bacterium]|nr:four helix bundle protein [Bacteroidales bacterium]
MLTISIAINLGIYPGFIKFAVRCVNLFKDLTENKKEFVISKQLLRSGTSIGANIRETQNAESKADFIHKLAISQKECDESMYWLELLEATGFLSQEEYNSIKREAQELLKLLRSSILTTKQKL